MIDADKLLADIPKGLRDPLIEEYQGICKAFNEGRWKLTALDAGRFCEVVFTILDGALSGQYASTPSKPGNFVDSCKALEKKPPALVGDRSLRLLIPRLLPALYEIRNNRNVGHVGGDVAPNKMDATFAREAATWVVAELVRIMHGIDTAQAQAVVDALVERTHPLVWEIEGTKRVLSTQMRAGERALVLLYSTPEWIAISQLKDWVRYNGSFKDRVLKQLFDAHQIEISGDKVIITPLGVKFVEQKLLS